MQTKYILIGQNMGYGPYDRQNALLKKSYDHTLVLFEAENVEQIVRRYGLSEKTYLKYDNPKKVMVKGLPQKERVVHELSCDEKTEFIHYRRGSRPKPHTASRMQVPKHIWAKVKSIERGNDIEDEYRAFLPKVPHLEVGWWDDYCRRHSSGWKHNRKTEWKHSKPSYRKISEFSEREGNLCIDTDSWNAQ